jgi:hypothetical protein
LHGTISYTFNGIAAKSDVLPEQAILQRYERLKKDFPSSLVHRTTLVRNLEAYRKGTASPVDLVVVTTFNFMPDHDRLRCSFRLYELEGEPADLRKLDWEAEVTISMGEIQRATLIAGAKLAMHVADNGFDLVKNDHKYLWEGLLKNFREYYDVLDNRKKERDENWKGHVLWKDKNCTGKKCVAAWLQAYVADSDSRDKENEAAVDRLRSEARKVTQLLSASFTEGIED